MDARELLKSCTSEYLKPVEKISVSQWSEKHLQLPQTSAEPGLWRVNRAPYQQGLMDAICEPKVQKVTIMTSAQTGKSTVCNAIIARFIDIDPCPIMFTQPTIQLAQRFSKEKLSPMIADIKVLSDKIVQAERHASSTILMKLFKGGLLALSGANSPASLASMSIRLLLCDEIDKYPPSAGVEGDPVELAIQRTATYWNKKIVLVSTPSIKGASRIEDSYEKSDKRLYYVPCPHCGHEQHLIWDRVEYPGKGTEHFKPEEGIYYICESCEHPIGESKKSWMVNNGHWQATSKAENPNHVGFHCNRLISPWVNWLDIAHDFEASKNDPLQLQVFVNSSLGLPFERETGQALDWQRLYQRSLNSNYERGQVPDSALILTCGVDVQGDRLEASIWGYGRNQESWLIDHQEIYGDPLDDVVWQQLKSLVTKPYQNESGASLRIRATCIDTGYLTHDVYMQVRRLNHLHCFAIKGQAGNHKMFVSRPRNMEVNYQGKTIKNGIKLYMLGVDRAKEMLFYRSQVDVPGNKYIHFPKSLHSSYFEGFCSEVQVKKHRAGQPYYAWEKIPGVHNNEPLDTAIYALAAGHLVGIHRANWNAIEKEIKETKQPVNDENKPISKERKRTRKITRR